MVVNSLGPFGGFLPIPRIFFSDFTSAFILYLLVTRYKLVEAWLVSKTAIRTDETRLMSGKQPAQLKITNT